MICVLLQCVVVSRLGLQRYYLSTFEVRCREGGEGGVEPPTSAFIAPLAEPGLASPPKNSDVGETKKEEE